jgi:hypothetical protein
MQARSAIAESADRPIEWMVVDVRIEHPFHSPDAFLVR